MSSTTSTDDANSAQAAKSNKVAGTEQARDGESLGEEILRWIGEVESRCGVLVYDKLSGILNDTNDNRVLRRLSILLDGHPDLIEHIRKIRATCAVRIAEKREAAGNEQVEVNIESEEMEEEEEEDDDDDENYKLPVIDAKNLDKANLMLLNVKVGCHDRPGTYEEFMGILQRFRKEEITKAEALARVETVLSFDPELIYTFKQFAGIHENQVYVLPLRGTWNFLKSVVGGVYGIFYGFVARVLSKLRRIF